MTTKTEKEAKKAEEVVVDEEVEVSKPAKMADLLPQDEEALDDVGLVAFLTGDDGKIKLDESLPSEYENEIMAQQVLDVLSALAQANQAYRAARNLSDNTKKKQLFEQINSLKVTAAIIQYEFPEAKKIADRIARLKVHNTNANRDRIEKEASEQE